MCSNYPGIKLEPALGAWEDKIEHLSLYAHVVHTIAKQVISRRRKNENVYKMSKNEKCTCKACKNSVFHCQICKFVGFSFPLSSWLLKPHLHEQFLCGNCIWQFLFARVDDRQIFVFKLRQAMPDGQNLGTLGTGFCRCRWKNCHILCGVSSKRTIIFCGNFYLPHKNQRVSFSANAFDT